MGNRQQMRAKVGSKHLGSGWASCHPDQPRTCRYCGEKCTLKQHLWIEDTVPRWTAHMDCWRNR